MKQRVRRLIDPTTAFTSAIAATVWATVFIAAGVSSSLREGVAVVALAANSKPSGGDDYGQTTSLQSGDVYKGAVESPVSDDSAADDTCGTMSAITASASRRQAAAPGDPGGDVIAEESCSSRMEINGRM